METLPVERFDVSGRDIAVLRRPGRAPGLFWLPGYTADMTGTKATAIDGLAAERGLAFTRFDYSGHGQSGGNFLAGTISDWLEEALAVFDHLTGGPQLVVGSSMGGWLALLLASALLKRGDSRLSGLILLAPATDMTKDLMWDRFSRKARTAIEKTGQWANPAEDPRGNYNIITRKLIKDGEKHLFGDRPIEVGCPVHILQGVNDADVPWTHAPKLVERLASDDVVLTLVKDGDHRLSRPEDIERLFSAIRVMLAEIGGG